MKNKTFNFSPIGHFRCQQKHSYDVPRQAVLGENTGVIELVDDHNFVQALEGLEKFEKIWILFQFHHNDHWLTKVHPPRHSNQKMGVFSTRAPYRPNPIGMSCVDLVKIDGTHLHVAHHDILDGTPILDIKPYVTLSDCFPDAGQGWLGSASRLAIRYDDLAQEQLEWFEKNSQIDFRSFILTQLESEPENGRRKRILPSPAWLLKDYPEAKTLAYRTWRIAFEYHTVDETVWIHQIFSGYSNEEMTPDAADPYSDKAIHREFRALYPFPQ